MTDTNGEFTELYRKHRPTMFKQVVGQDTAVKSLTGLLKTGFPHALLLAGPSGTGKTTIARILKDKLKCGDSDFCEINCAAVEKAIDTIRGVQSSMWLAPTTGESRVFYLDEVQSFSRAGFAQQAMLKMLEDTPKHAYFILATTDPDKLVQTIRGRCTRVDLKKLDDKIVRSLVEEVCRKEQCQHTDTVVKKIVEVAKGSAREALVLLGKVLNEEDELEALEAILPPEVERKAFDLAKALLWEKPGWAEVRDIIESIEKEDSEKVRRLVLSCAVTEALKQGSVGKKLGYAYKVLQAFEHDFFNSDRGGLVRACIEVVMGS